MSNGHQWTCRRSSTCHSSRLVTAWLSIDELVGPSHMMCKNHSPQHLWNWGFIERNHFCYPWVLTRPQGRRLPQRVRCSIGQSRRGCLNVLEGCRSGRVRSGGFTGGRVDVDPRAITNTTRRTSSCGRCLATDGGGLKNQTVVKYSCRLQCYYFLLLTDHWLTIFRLILIY